VTYVPFARQSVGLDHRGYSQERALNWYARAFPTGASGELMLAPCPGFSKRKDIGAGDVRAMLALGVFLYIAAGGKLWRLNYNTGALTELGNIADDVATTMATTGTDVAVCAGGGLRAWSTDTASFHNPTATLPFSDIGSVAAGDGYFVATEITGKRFAYSGLNDARTWDALDFYSAEADPDQIKRVVNAFQEFWIFGESTCEVWSVVGGSDVLSRNPGGVFDTGIAWKASAVQLDDALYWVGDDKVVYRARGYQPQRVSQEGVEALLQDYDEDDALKFFRYVWKGHSFYVIRFPDRPAWVYDTTTGLWHERNTGADRADPWLACCATEWQGVQVLGTPSGKVVDIGGLTDDGATIAREAVSVPFVVGDEYVTMRGLTAHLKTGETDLGRDAQVSLEVRRKTYDDWRTWSVERWRSLGDGGEDKVARWHALGRARGWQFRLRVTDPVETALYGVTYDPAR